MTQEVCGFRFYCKKLDKKECKMFDWRKCKYTKNLNSKGEVNMSRNKDEINKLYRVEVQFPIKIINVRACSPEKARMRVLDEEEDIPIDAVVSNGVEIK